MMNGGGLSLVFNIVNILLWIGIAYAIYTFAVKYSKKNKRNEEKIEKIEAMVEDMHKKLG